MKNSLEPPVEKIRSNTSILETRKSNFIELSNFNSRNSLDQSMSNETYFEPRVLVFKTFEKNQSNRIDLEEKTSELNKSAEQEQRQNPIAPDEKQKNNGNMSDLFEPNDIKDINYENPLEMLVNEVVRSPSFFYQVENVTHSEVIRFFIFLNDNYYLDE